MSGESMATCEKCGHSWAEGGVPGGHAWASSTGRIVQKEDVDSDGKPVDPGHVGAMLWTSIKCDDATPEQVDAYKAIRRGINERVVVEGTEGYGKEQLGA